MKSLHHGKAAANAKLKGKLSKRLSCLCCSLFNFKDSQREKEAQKEISNFNKNITG